MDGREPSPSLFRLKAASGPILQETDRDRFLPFRCQKPFAVPFSTKPTNPKELRGSLAYISPLPFLFRETPSLQ